MRDADPEPIKVAPTADAEAIAAMPARLSSSAPPFARADLEAMLVDLATMILAARAGGEIVGVTRRQTNVYRRMLPAGAAVR